MKYGILDEGNGRDLFFYLKRKEAEEARYQKYPNFIRQKDRYRTELWRALYQKAPKGQFLIFRKTLTEFANIELFPNALGRIFQVEGQSVRII